MKNIFTRILQFIKSSLFFKIILVFFIFESVWIAFSAAYPQAFDEDFHFGLIQVYSHYWLPFLSGQPTNANAFGAVARDPSYLYHYLMSFPYRIVALSLHQQIQQVIALRLINIGLFIAGLVLSRRVLLRVRISHALTNIILAIFVLIPIVPQLAAQINYDNLLIPLIAWSILLTFQVIDQLQAKKPSMRHLVGLFSLCFLTSIEKYAFLPIFAGIVFFLAIVMFMTYRHKLRLLVSQLWKNWQAQSAISKVGLIVLLLISFGMFAQRDLVNLFDYHSIEPDCAVVLNVKDCSAYSPWFYNYNNHIGVVKAAGSIPYMNPLSYVLNWFYWMWYRLFFAINGPGDSFINYPPLPLPSAAAILITAVGGIAIIKYRRQVFKGNNYLILLLVISAFYVAALIIQGYSTYRYTNVLENMNGRYLLPILLFVAAILGRGLSLLLCKSSTRRVIFSVVIVLLFLQGGGIFTFIDRSDENWDLSNSAVVKANNIARHITEPVIIDGKTQYTTSRWFFN
jgi:hypothetical protein